MKLKIYVGTSGGDNHKGVPVLDGHGNISCQPKSSDRSDIIDAADAAIKYASKFENVESVEFYSEYDDVLEHALVYKYSAGRMDKFARKIGYIGGTGYKQHVSKALTTYAENIARVKQWVNQSGATLNPTEFSNRIANFSHDLTVTILNAEERIALGLHGINAVSQGSNHPGYLVKVEYKGNPDSNESIAIIGKGITFDTGGYNIKGDDMWEMNLDMAGAAAAFGAIRLTADLRLKKNVTGYFCIAENAIGPRAYLPGSIIKAPDGRQIMVENTDAEGRLVLMDGIALAVKDGHKTIIDIATLTGAIQRALGDEVAGLFTNRDNIAKLFQDDYDKHHEHYWRMPLFSGYRKHLDSKFADFKNCSNKAGAITAALFLKEFVPDDVAWAHLDIAGTAWADEATGFGVKSLVHFIQEYAND